MAPIDSMDTLPIDNQAEFQELKKKEVWNNFKKLANEYITRAKTRTPSAKQTYNELAPQYESLQNQEAIDVIVFQLPNNIKTVGILINKDGEKENKPAKSLYEEYTDKRNAYLLLPDGTVHSVIRTDHWIAPRGGQKAWEFKTEVSAGSEPDKDGYKFPLFDGAIGNPGHYFNCQDSNISTKLGLMKVAKERIFEKETQRTQILSEIMIKNLEKFSGK